MTTERSGYVAYLLRLWRSEANGEVVWRASVENPHTGERHGFASLDLLFEFLLEQTVGTTVQPPNRVRSADDA